MDKIPKSYYLYLAILAFAYAVYFLYDAPSVEAPPTPASLIDEPLPAAESNPVVPFAPEETPAVVPPPELNSFDGLEEEKKSLETLENLF